MKAEKKILGFVGLGLMGIALAERALGAGFEVAGFDLRPERCRALRRLGGRPVASVRDVAACAQRLVFAVMTTAQVEAALALMGRALRRGVLIVDTSTGEPNQIARLAARARRRGISYLDATIAGNSAETRAGRVLVLAGGDARAFNRCRDFFDCFASRAFHLGPSGHGARMKLVFNLVLGLHRAVLGEALVFARRIGVDPELALEIMKSGTAYSRVMDNKGRKMLARDFAPQAKLEQHLKDVELILGLGKQTGSKLPLSQAHRSLLRKLVACGAGPLDNSAIIQAFE